MSPSKSRMGPEAKLYKKLRKVSKDISWIRIENLSLLWVLPIYWAIILLGHFFTVELKVHKREHKVRFSPHQIAFHKTASEQYFHPWSRPLVKGPRNFFKGEIIFCSLVQESESL